MSTQSTGSTEYSVDCSCSVTTFWCSSLNPREVTVPGGMKQPFRVLRTSFYFYCLNGRWYEIFLKELTSYESFFRDSSLIPPIRAHDSLNHFACSRELCRWAESSINDGKFSGLSEVISNDGRDDLDFIRSEGERSLLATNSCLAWEASRWK